MILSARELLAELDSGALQFDPPIDRKRQVQDASIDVRLSPLLRVPVEKKNFIIQITDVLSQEIYGEEKTIEDDGFNLRPNRLVLGMTLEKVILPLHLAARLEGRSSLARLGLIVHATSAHIAPGFRRPVVLEIINFGVNKIALKPEMLIAQLIFEKVSMNPSKGYSGQFAEQDRP